MKKEELIGLIPSTVRDLDVRALGSLLPAKNIAKLPLYKGKVRDILDFGSHLFIFTSDRISAFDRILTTIPCKGEILNRISVFWFDKTGDKCYLSEIHLSDSDGYFLQGAPGQHTHTKVKATHKKS